MSLGNTDIVGKMEKSTEKHSDEALDRHQSSPFPHRASADTTGIYQT
jgi:hypothetical protein